MHMIKVTIVKRRSFSTGFLSRIAFGSRPRYKGVQERAGEAAERSGPQSARAAVGAGMGPCQRGFKEDGRLKKLERGPAEQHVASSLPLQKLTIRMVEQATGKILAGIARGLA